MFYPHEALSLPPSNTVIWRYLSLAKFISLLNDSKLFFSRSDKFEDCMEGKMSVMDKKIYESWGASNIAERMERGGLGCAFINCWVMSEEELYLMWSAYSSLTEGVAVKSSIERLINSLDANDKREIYISDVQYLDYEKQNTFDKTGKILNALAPYFCKRSYFNQERELRMVHYDYKMRPNKDNCYVEFDVCLDTLIDEIWVSPKAAPWFVKLIDKELELHSINRKANISRMAETLLP